MALSQKYNNLSDVWKTVTQMEYRLIAYLCVERGVHVSVHQMEPLASVNNIRTFHSDCL